ncbi:MAG: hypothetical protein U0768_12220 [Anaerolineae bacterium]
MNIVEELVTRLARKRDAGAINLTCIAENGTESFARVSQGNTFRHIVLFPFRRRRFVVKLYSRVVGVISWQEILDAKRGSDEAAHYLPVAPTLYVYGLDAIGEPSIIRVQRQAKLRICDMSDEELLTPGMVAQQLAILDGAERMVAERGWLPDMFGHPDSPRLVVNWPSIRHSTNIMLDGQGHLVFVDINDPYVLNRTDNPLGRLSVWGARRRLARHHRFLQRTQSVETRHGASLR